MAVGVKINLESCMVKVHEVINKRGRAVAQKRAYNLYYRAKNRMLRDFDIHPITNELKTKGSSDNISLSNDGYGNLYGFLGFEGAEPTAALRNLLEAGTFLRYTGQRTNTWYFRIQMPEDSSIEEVTSLPWGSGRSWVDVVENGVSNLDMYLHKKGVGRSKQGIQAPYEINDDIVFHNQPYLTEILENMRARINNSSIQI